MGRYPFQGYKKALNGMYLHNELLSIHKIIRRISCAVNPCIKIVRDTHRFFPILTQRFKILDP
jgi:hypothetical protein